MCRGGRARPPWSAARQVGMHFDLHLCQRACNDTVAAACASARLGTCQRQGAHARLGACCKGTGQASWPGGHASLLLALQQVFTSTPPKVEQKSDQYLRFAGRPRSAANVKKEAAADATLPRQMAAVSAAWSPVFPAAAPIASGANPAGAAYPVMQMPACERLPLAGSYDISPDPLIVSITL